MPLAAFLHQTLIVHVLRLPADDGVLFRYALSPLLKRSDLGISYAAGATAALANSRGFADPGIMIRSAVLGQ